MVGSYQQGPFRVQLEETPGGVGDWHLVHDPAGSFSGMSWRSAPAGMDAFAERHVWLSTSPESGFVKTMCAQRRDASGADIMRGLTLKRVGEGEFETQLSSLADLLDALGDVFGLDVSAVAADARRRLWDKVLAAHEAWVAAGE